MSRRRARQRRARCQRASPPTRSWPWRATRRALHAPAARWLPTCRPCASTPPASSSRSRPTAPTWVPAGVCCCCVGHQAWLLPALEGIQCARWERGGRAAAEGQAAALAGGTAALGLCGSSRSACCRAVLRPLLSCPPTAPTPSFTCSFNRNAGAGSLQNSRLARGQHALGAGAGAAAGGPGVALRRLQKCAAAGVLPVRWVAAQAAELQWVLLAWVLSTSHFSTRSGALVLLPSLLSGGTVVQRWPGQHLAAGVWTVAHARGRCAAAECMQAAVERVAGLRLARCMNSAAALH